MSAGNFVVTKYEASYAAGQIHPIRVQEETLALLQDSGGVNDATNDPPAGAVNNPISALVNLNRGARGLRPRYVVASWNAAKPAGYTGDTVRIPILTINNFNNLAVGESIAYLGTTAIIVAKEPERAR